MKGTKLTKKVVATALSVTMLASLLAGCGESSPKGENQSAENQNVDNSVEESSQAEVSESSGGVFDFTSVSDVTFPLEEKLELTVFVNAATTGGGTYQNNYTTAWIEEKTNIHLNFLYDLDGDDAKTKLNLVMTDPSSMPDIFLTTKWTKSEVQSYGEQGLLLPLNEYLEDAPNWNKLNEQCPLRRADNVMADGNIYTYGDCNECFHCMYQNRMWIYMPWVEALNDGKIPETTDELYDYLVKVKTQDPNGNGQADEVPMTGFIGGWSTDPTVWLINAFVQCNNPLSNTNPTTAAGLVLNDGKVEYTVMSEQYREAMKYINKLYKEGLLDNQTFTQDNTQFSAIVDSEEINIVALHPGGTTSVDGTHFWAYEPGRWQDWDVLEPVAGPDGVRLAAKGLSDYFGSSLGSVSSNCKYPEIAVALFDFLASEEGTLVQSFGPEGVGWDWTNEGTAVNGQAPLYDAIILPEDYDWLGNGFDTDFGKNKSWVSDAMIGCRTADFRGGQKIENPEVNTEYILQKAAERYAQYAPDDSSIMPNLVFAGQDAQTVSEGTLTIGGYVNQATVQFITGDLDPEKDWDTYIGKLKDMGVDNYIEIYQKYYDAYSANLK